MLKSNGTKTIILAVTGFIFSLVALLIFLCLPASEIANSLEYSAKIALWILVASPLCSAIGSASFIYAFLKDYKSWCNCLSKEIALGATVLSGLFSVFSFAVYFSYTVSQFSLGFVAPFSGTVYEYLAVATTMLVIIKFIFTAVAIISVRRN